MSAYLQRLAWWNESERAKQILSSEKSQLEERFLDALSQSCFRFTACGNMSWTNPDALKICICSWTENHQDIQSWLWLLRVEGIFLWKLDSGKNDSPVFSQWRDWHGSLVHSTIWKQSWHQEQASNLFNIASLLHGNTRKEEGCDSIYEGDHP